MSTEAPELDDTILKMLLERYEGEEKAKSVNMIVGGEL